jgi:3-dehydroquinate synthase
MHTVTIQGRQGRSRLLVGASIDALDRQVPLDRTVILTDERVKALYGARFPQAPVITIPTGEGHKTLASLEHIYERLVALEADRSSFLVGIGGGMVCDVAGFAASTFLRGIGFGFVATTLLAQVDASVGGKNGVNFGGFKNMVGVFSQPEFVICDLELLATLPPGRSSAAWPKSSNTAPSQTSPCSNTWKAMPTTRSNSRLT